MRRTILACLLCLAVLFSAGCGLPWEKPRPEPITVVPAPSEDTTGVLDSPAEIPAPTEKPFDAVIEMERLRGDDSERVLIRARDDQGQTIWQREFTTEYVTELSLIEEIGVWQDRYYFNHAGTVTCLRITDGATLWENSDFRGASISSLIDDRNGNIYLCGWYGPDFFAADAQGNTLARFESLFDGFFWSSGMRRLDENTLELRYHSDNRGYAEEGIPYYVDLTDYSAYMYTVPRNISENERHWINIFLSDFIEQNLTGFDVQTAGYYEMAEYARVFCRINRPSGLNREASGESMSLEDANRLCQRFFDRSMSFVNPDYTEKESELLHTGADGAVWRYEKGRLYFPPAEEGLYNRFAVVEEVWTQEADALRFSFEIYALNEKEYAARGMDAALYDLTPEQAERMAAQGRIVRLGSGTALVRPYPDGAAQLYGMPAGSVGYWLLELTTDLPEAHG